MAIGPSTSAVLLHRTQLDSSPSIQNRTPSSVTVHPVALFSILDHYLRRTKDQSRVIGTLLGTRSATGDVVHVNAAFAVVHSETSEMVAVDEEYHKTMCDLHRRVAPSDVVVGWYSTGSTLNTYSALIQNFYSQEIAPHQAVHLVLNTGLVEGEKAGVLAYTSSPVGVYPKPENCVFVPIPVDLRFHDTEHSGLNLLKSQTAAFPSSSLETLEASLQSVINLIDRVLGYVKSVLSGEIEGNKAVGRYLMDTLGSSDTEMSGFNASLQDTLMVSYLSNLVRSQAEVSSRLALTTST